MFQCLTAIEYVHRNGFAHRDIKPDNFTIGLNENSNILYLIDFGLSIKYRSTKTSIHIELRNNKKLTGTARYASINALRGFEQSRRDDLESIGYVLVYLLKGSLPWQGLKVEKDEDRYDKIYKKKLHTSPEELCKDLPGKFEQLFKVDICKFIEYARKLEFEEDPDYAYLRNLFFNIMEKSNYEFDHIYDWSTVNINDSNKSIQETHTFNKTSFNNANPNSYTYF